MENDTKESIINKSSFLLISILIIIIIIIVIVYCVYQKKNKWDLQTEVDKILEKQKNNLNTS